MVAPNNQLEQIIILKHGGNVITFSNRTGDEVSRILIRVTEGRGINLIFTATAVEVHPV